MESVTSVDAAAPTSQLNEAESDIVWIYTICRRPECFDVYYLIENLKYKFSKKHDVYGSKEYEQGFTDGANQVIDYIETLCTKELKI